MTPDLLIVGAGPAGLGAAVEAAAHGLSVMLLDENSAPGGRIWQALETRGAKDTDEAAALVLIERFWASDVQTCWSATVWAIEPDGQVYWSDADGAHSLATRNIMIATGTTERPVPIPGWTLPGVMTIGAAQIAMKTGGLVPGANTWLAGQGPLLLLYATEVLDAGGQIAGVIDLSDGFAPLRAVWQISLSTLPEIRRGLAWRRQLAKAGIRWVAATELRASPAPEGEDLFRFATPGVRSSNVTSSPVTTVDEARAGGDGPLAATTALQSISFRTRDGWKTEAADLLLLHDGIIPSTQITRALGCRHTWSTNQRCWYPATDDHGRTSIPGILVAGDGAGIGGAAAAVLSGRIAARGLIGADTAPLRVERARALIARPLLDTLFAPRPMHLHDTTLVCRCEEVTAGAVREAARAGCQGMNQLKAYTRCGMGPCQGRVCGPVAIEVLAEVRNVPVSTIEPLRTRFPTKPVAVGALTSL